MHKNIFDLSMTFTNNYHHDFAMLDLGLNIDNLTLIIMNPAKKRIVRANG